VIQTLANVHVVTLTKRANAVETLQFRWVGGGEELVRDVRQCDVAAVSDMSAEVRRASTAGGEVRRLLDDLGRSLGHIFVGLGNLPLFCRMSRFGLRNTVLAISGEIEGDILWESMILPGEAVPIALSMRPRFRTDHIRLHEGGTQHPTTALRPKCLSACSSNAIRRLSTKEQLEGLQRLMPGRLDVMFRTVVNPDVIELRARLRLQCAMFLFAGHGEYDGNQYFVELGGELVGLSRLSGDLARSGSTVLVFDSCNSGCGDAKRGAPSLLSSVPPASCLVGMQGASDDAVSTRFTPRCVVEIINGEPIWAAVGRMRRDMAADHLTDWFMPVVHLKADYRSFSFGPPEWRVEG
jgi:hypothetical protein